METVMEVSVPVLTEGETTMAWREALALKDKAALAALCLKIREGKAACSPLLAAEMSLLKWQANEFKDDGTPGYVDNKWTLGRTASTCPCCAAVRRDKNGVADCTTCLLGVVQEGPCTLKTANEATYVGNKGPLVVALSKAVLLR